MQKAAGRLLRVTRGLLPNTGLTPERTGRWPVLFVCLYAFLAQPVAHAESQHEIKPSISIIIDDLGKALETGRRTLNLPGAVACSFLPKQRYTKELAETAHREGKEVLLHLPMDSVDGRPLDDGAVTLDMTERQFLQVVQDDLASVPNVIGINNHMGSLLTRHPGHMRWLMQEMQRSGALLFVDSRTSVATVARQVAEENSVPAVDRNVFLDNSVVERDIAFQFQRLLQLARKHGTALAIGHPYPQTLAFLEQQLPQLKHHGIRLVPVAELIRLQQEGDATWQASLSPSHKAVKN